MQSIIYFFFVPILSGLIEIIPYTRTTHWAIVGSDPRNTAEYVSGAGRESAGNEYRAGGENHRSQL